ncbi:MAG: hypothetical protein KAV87_18250 [Desulfobacteraceae bacterium]|nr:hypothetical protein [Desulfobacteraceae bacterium]
MIRADQPWERDAAFLHSSLVIYDEQEKLFKGWYQGGGCHGPGDGSNMCYATSSDGVHWDKPSLGEVEFEGSKDNNIVLLADCMMHDPAPVIDYKDPDSQRRFKTMWWGGRRDASANDGWLLGHCVAFSPDGIHWTEHPHNPVWVGDAEETLPLGIEHHKGKLVAFTSVDGYGMRVVGRTESDDFVHWDLPPKLVFKSDDEDPPGTEMAGMAAVDYYGTYIGMLYVIHNLLDITREQWREMVERNIRQGFFGPPIALNTPKSLTVHNEVVTSLDGVEWKRICREPFIEFGPEGSWDECINSAARPLVANDQIYIYYAGMGRIRQTPGVKKPQPIANWSYDTGLATLRLDGFASLDAGTAEGMLVTKEFILNGTEMCVNVDASGGFVRAEILDNSGQPIPGFAVDQATPVTGDQLRGELTWAEKSGLGELRGRRVKLKLALENSQLYSISILKQKNG